jgi:hypothetical protein
MKILSILLIAAALLGGSTPAPSAVVAPTPSPRPAVAAAACWAGPPTIYRADQARCWRGVPFVLPVAVAP